MNDKLIEELDVVTLVVGDWTEQDVKDIRNEGRRIIEERRASGLSGDEPRAA